MEDFMKFNQGRQEVNPYQYVNSNPVKYRDPSGLLADSGECGFGPMAEALCPDNYNWLGGGDWPPGPPPGTPYLTTPWQLAKLGFTPVNTDPLVLKFYMDPNAFDFQVDVTYESDPLGSVMKFIFSNIVPNCISQFDIPDSNTDGFDGNIALVNLTDLDKDGIVEFQRFVVTNLVEYHVAMQAEWTQSLTYNHATMVESFPIGPPLSSLPGYEGALPNITLGVVDVHLRPRNADRGIQLLSEYMTIRPQGSSPTLPPIPMFNMVQFTTTQDSETTIKTLGEFFIPGPNRLTHTIEYRGTLKPGWNDNNRLTNPIHQRNMDNHPMLPVPN